MEGVKEKQGQLVFGLDIGTRSIVGTVGYLNGGKFHVLAQRSKEHEPCWMDRSMTSARWERLFPR